MSLSRTFLEITTSPQLHKFAGPTSFPAKPLLHPLSPVCFQIAAPILAFCSGHTPAMLTRTMASLSFLNPASRLLHFPLLCHLGQKTHCHCSLHSPHSPNDHCQNHLGSRLFVFLVAAIVVLITADHLGEEKLLA